MAITSLVDYYSDLWDIQNRLLRNGQVDITANYSLNEELARLTPYREEILAALHTKEQELVKIEQELEELKAQYEAAILPADKAAALALVTAKEKEKSQLERVINSLENHTTLARYDQLLNDNSATLTVYDIDLLNKTINGPDAFGVVNDKCTQDRFFSFDRYFDHVDLTTKVCLFQFKNTDDQEFFLPIEEYDITTLADENKVIMKVNIPQKMFVAGGEIFYNFRFYTIEKYSEIDYKITYSFSMPPTKTRIYDGIESYGFYEYEYDPTVLQNYENALELIPSTYQLNWETL